MVKGTRLERIEKLASSARRRPLAFHPVTGRPGWSSRPFLSPNPCLFPGVPIHGADIDGLRERKGGCAAGGAATGCAAMTCVGVGERGTEGRRWKDQMEKGGGRGDDGRRHPSKGCRRCFCSSAAGVPLAGLHACCIGFVPSCARPSLGAHSEARRAQLKSTSLAFYCCSAPVPGRQAAPARPYLLVHTPLAPLSCTYPIRSTPCMLVMYV
jgi:hypothetical protein